MRKRQKNYFTTIEELREAVPLLAQQMEDMATEVSGVDLMLAELFGISTKVKDGQMVTAYAPGCPEWAILGAHLHRLKEGREMVRLSYDRYKNVSGLRFIVNPAYDKATA